MSAIAKLIPKRFQAILQEIATEAIWAFTWTTWGFILASIFGVSNMQFGLLAPLAPITISAIVLIGNWKNNRSYRIRSLSAFVICWGITALAIHFGVQ